MNSDNNLKFSPIHGSELAYTNKLKLSTNITTFKAPHNSLKLKMPTSRNLKCYIVGNSNVVENSGNRPFYSCVLSCQAFDLE